MEVRYFSRSSGRLPVLEYIKALDQRRERAECYEIIDALEQDAVVWGRGCDVDHLGGGLYELRPRLHRILFGLFDEVAVLLHAAPKKGRTLPKRDLDLARRRLKEVSDELT